MKLNHSKQRRLAANAKQNGGWAMVVTVVVILVAASTASVMLSSSLTGNSQARVARDTTAARYRAEGGLASAQKTLLNAVADYRTPPATGSVTFGGETVEYRIESTGSQDVETDASGIQSIHTGYRLDATGEAFRAKETASQFMDVVTIPIFQFAVFYASDLEINPGPSMTLSGRIHTNGSLYLNSGNTLTLDTNYVRAVGNILRHRKDDPSRSSGDVEIRHWVENPFNPLEPEVFSPLLSRDQLADLGVSSQSGYDSNFVQGFDADGDGLFTGLNDWLPWALGALEYWSEPDNYPIQGSTVQTADHGLSEATVPSINSIGMFEPIDGGDFVLNASGIFEPAPGGAGTGTHNRGFFHEEAGLSILTLPDGSIEATDDAGIDVTADVAPFIEVTTLYDARQGGDVQVTRIDVEGLNASNHYPSNGLLYASSYGTGTGTDLKGVQLVNGSTLAGALSVVTDGAAYIQGDYNTENKRGASVIADAVNLLSNNWDGTKGPGDLPGATETTFNLAFISGNQETQVGAYNGGFENLPRFHENWNGINANITGSFVNAWPSQFATGAWGSGSDRYRPPRRNWSYDTSFNTVGNLPPFTPSVVLGESVAIF